MARQHPTLTLTPLQHEEFKSYLCWGLRPSRCSLLLLLEERDKRYYTDHSTLKFRCVSERESERERDMQTDTFTQGVLQYMQTVTTHPSPKLVSFNAVFHQLSNTGPRTV